ncbi:carbohydrate kinase family protein [Candidatus Gottesmanbacteria bacterium]|nr:carbohydrate kinase family protein [Candidatus Gottesmanbacteria bacterium]
MDFSGRFADRIMPEKIHVLSLSFLVEHLSKQFGGTAGNVAHTLKLLGLDPLILAPVGNDFDPYQKFLETNNIQTTHIVKHTNVSTSAYFVMTDKTDNQIGAFFVGATKYAKDLSVGDALQGLALRGKARPYENFVVLAPTDPEAMKKYVKECRALGLPYLYDPAFQTATFTADELREGIEGAQILIGNDYEIALMKEKLGISHEELIMMVPILITTLGGKGSIIETRHDSIGVAAAKPKNMSDPTGAGDAYRAGFLAGYLRAVNSRPALELTGDELLVCGQMGSVAAVYTVEKYGTQTHTFTKKEFTKRYEENFGVTLSL